MAATSTDPILAALRAARDRRSVKTTKGSAELRLVAAEIRRASVFTSRGTSAVFASMIKEVIDQLASGRIGEADARLALLDTLRALGYTPEGGFPGAPAGEVPPAVKGTLQDISSFRRLDLIVRTQLEIVTGTGLQTRGHEPDRLRAAPAWELVRVIPVSAPRHWGGQHTGAEIGSIAPQSRWAIAGGRVTDNRLIAFKGDPVWGELGSSSNFKDGLDLDHPPFAFNSGMRWREVLRREVIELGVLGPDGQSLQEWETGARPLTLAGALPFPSPRMSVADVDPEIRSALEKDPAVEPVPGEPDKIQPKGASTRAERRAARAAKSAARWEQSRAERDEQYRKQP